MTSLLNPIPPFVFTLPSGRIVPGQSVTIIGEAQYSCNRFSINLVKQATLHNLFHFDSRFDQGQTVRNCNYPSGSWGHEERSPLTIVKGRTFYIELRVMQDRITVLIDGVHHCDWIHRAPMLEADTLQILCEPGQGQVRIQQVQFR